MAEVLEDVDLRVESLNDTPWVTIVWNDPVNLMTYVSWVFRSYFGHSREEAERLMLLVHRDDRHAASDHRHLTELSLVQRKIANARAVIRSLQRDPLVLDEAAVQSWLRHLTDLRLTVAARLQIVDDGDTGTGDEGMLDLYDWLGYLQGTLVECLE